MKLKKSYKIPVNSQILDGWVGPVNYIDSFQCEFENSLDLTIDDIACLIFLSESSRWEVALSSIRDSVAGLFGLKTGLSAAYHKPEIGSALFKPGDKIAFFPVSSRSDSEIIMALNDVHLGFKVSVLMRQVQGSGITSVHLTTSVQFHNIWGRIYFIPVKPFHQIIVKQCLKRFIIQYSKRLQPTI